MPRRIMAFALITCLLTGAAVYAAQGLSMKCQAKPEKDAATGKMENACNYETTVNFGGMMFSEQITGYCRSCKKFVYLHWARANAPLPPGMKVTPRPAPLGEVWDASTGKVMTIHACPACKGPFLEIKGPDELKYCPACNKPHFAVDKSKPEMAID